MSTQVPADIRALVESEQLQRAVAAPSLVRTGVILAGYVAASAVGLWAGHPVVWAVVWCGQAVVLNGAGSALHEGVHGNMARHRGINRVLGELWGLLLPLNFSLYRAFHLEHHRRTRVEGDPEPQVEFRSLWSYLLAMPFLGRLAVLEMWWFSLCSLFGRFPPYVRTARQRRAIRGDAVLVLIVTVGMVAATIASPRLVFFLWGIPVLLSSLVFSMTVLAEHYGCPPGPDQIQATRTVVSNRVFSYLYWENNFHTEHHLLPGVPYHRLRRLRDALGDRVVNTEPSYLRWHLAVARDLRRPAVIDLTEAAASPEHDVIDLRDPRPEVAGEATTPGRPRRERV